MENKTDAIDFSSILASSVHDMKNSLAMLLGSLAEITGDCSPETCPSHGKFLRIQHETQRVNRDLVVLLSLYKMDQGQYFFNVDEIEISDYLEEIILEYKALLQGHNIRITFQCDDELVGYFDRILIASVLKNIITNAYQYTKDSIIISAEMSQGYLKISVLDNGKGYPPQMLIDNTIKPSSIDIGTGSTGLGLYFSDRVAKLHKNKEQKGYIQLTNDADTQGGIFSIFLP
jgi:K+-sensing histidine kinase KdpD